MSSEANNSADEKKRFAVALSFSGRHRAYVRIVADALKRKLNENLDGEPEREVLYDKDYWGELSRSDLHRKLPDWYDNDAQLIVVFISEDYNNRYWCRLEWEKIRKKYIENRIYRNRLMPLFIGDRYAQEQERIRDAFSETFSALGLDPAKWGSCCIHEIDTLDEVVEQIHRRYKSQLDEIKEREREREIHYEFIENLKQEGLLEDVIDILRAYVSELMLVPAETGFKGLGDVLRPYDRNFRLYKNSARQNRTTVTRNALSTRSASLLLLLIRQVTILMALLLRSPAAYAVAKNSFATAGVRDYAPFRASQVELGPFGLAKFAGSHKNQRCQH
jgi:TIR domain-containing protein